MVQTLTVWSDETAEINTGVNFHLSVKGSISPQLDSKIEGIAASISANGISQLHVERDTFRQFEHAVKAGEVSDLGFGSTVSVVDFDWIMQQVDAYFAATFSQGNDPDSSPSEPDLL
jgi:hypothetical protein